MKKNKIGDIYYNPMAGDLWLLNKIWNDSEEKEVWTLNLIHNDLQEELKYVKGFVKVGNIYDILKEKQELINYLKEQITLCDERIDFHKSEISGVVNISDDNRHLILIKYNNIKQETYEEILSKIEKE